MEARDIVQETGIKTIPKKEKCKRAKWLSEEALQIAVKRRAGKSKGEKERYSHLNVEFQRIARREKKAYLSFQCKQIEENNRIRKTRDLFKKIRNTKGTFHASSVQFSCSVVSNSLLPCPSPTPGAYSNSCPSSQRCHPTILSSVIPFSCFNLSQHQGQ